MTKDPWDLPVDETSKPILEALIAKYEAEGQNRELGICCSRMANFLKHIGPMDEAVTFGHRAVAYLRSAEDRKEYARALRIACLPFTIGPHREYLEESLKISREIGDKEEEGWTLFRLTKPLHTAGKSMADIVETLSHGSVKENQMMLAKMEKTRDRAYTLEGALAVFEEIGNKVGIATCLVSLGVERMPHDRAHFERAISLYLEAGDLDGADKAQKMADVFAPMT